MSAPTLKTEVQHKLRALIDEYKTALASAHGSTFDELRLQQGVIAGLAMANDVINDCFKVIGG